jgi:hypothetical protein
MIGYDIYLLQMGGSGQETCTNVGKRQLYTKDSYIQKEKQYTKQ